MLRRIRRITFAATAMVVVASGRAASLMLPVEGELTGKLDAFAADGAPTLEWKLEVRGDGAQRSLGFMARGEGTELQGEVRWESERKGTWRLAEAKTELSAWSRVMAKRLPAEVSDMALTGQIRLRGDGTWDGSQLGGQLYLSVSNARIEIPSQEFVLEGVELEFVLEDMRTWRSAPAQMISWRSGRYATLELEEGRIMFTLAGKQVQIDEGVLAALGGQINLAAFAFSLDKPELSFITRAVGIDIPMLVPLLPFLAEATGEVDGTLLLRYSSRDGIAIGGGELSLRQGEVARLRLLPSPGLITDRVPPEVFDRVPLAGEILRDNLRKVEMGENIIRAQRFDVSFMPEGDKEGRTAVFRMAGESIDPRIRAPIDLTVNYRGPVEWLVRFGQDSRLRMGGSR